jgi:hypothetical protein
MKIIELVKPLLLVSTLGARVNTVFLNFVAVFLGRFSKHRKLSYYLTVQALYTV